MAKLGLVFICIFLIVQWSLAGRVVRDAPETPTKAEGSDSFNFSAVLSNLTQELQKTFSKENLDKLMENLGETGEKFKQFGQTLIVKAQETAADITNSGKKDQPST